MNQTDLFSIAGVVFIIAVLVGAAFKVHEAGANKVMRDLGAMNPKIKDLAYKIIGETLKEAGFEDNYEAFENHVAYITADQIRVVLDNDESILKGITAAITDGMILDCIYSVIEVSGVRNDIKKAYDDLIAKRLKEMEKEDDKVEEENKQLEDGTYPETDDEYGMPAFATRNIGPVQEKADGSSNDQEPKKEPDSVDVYEVVE